MVRMRIPEFEFYVASQPVRSLWDVSATRGSCSIRSGGGMPHVRRVRKLVFLPRKKLGGSGLPPNFRTKEGAMRRTVFGRADPRIRNIGTLVLETRRRRRLVFPDARQNKTPPLWDSWGGAVCWPAVRCAADIVSNSVGVFWFLGTRRTNRAIHKWPRPINTRPRQKDVAPLRWLAFTSDPSPVQCSGGIFSGGMFGRRLPLAFYL